MAYATIALLKQYAGIDDGKHDVLLTSLIERAQAAIERYVGFSFEASADTTRTFDSKASVDGRTLWFDTWCCEITTVTNGDSTVIAATDYATEPRNDAPYYAITLLGSSGYTWASDDDGNPEDAISITGRWAYSTAAPADIEHITLRLALWMYRQRDNSTDLDRPMLAEGVTILPAMLPKDVLDVLDAYRWRGTGGP